MPTCYPLCIFFSSGSMKGRVVWYRCRSSSQRFAAVGSDVTFLFAIDLCPETKKHWFSVARKGVICPTSSKPLVAGPASSALLCSPAARTTAEQVLCVGSGGKMEDGRVRCPLSSIPGVPTLSDSAQGSCPACPLVILLFLSLGCVCESKS